MRKIIVLSVISLLLSVESIAKDLKIAVIDTTYVFANTSAASTARNALKGETEKAQNLITKMEEKLRLDEEALLEQKETLSAEKFAEVEKRFRAEYKQYRIQSQRLQDQLTRHSMIKKKEIMAEIQRAVEVIAIDRDYDLVLPSSALIYRSESIDISKEVLKAVNKTLESKPKKGL